MRPYLSAIRLTKQEFLSEPTENLSVFRKTVLLFFRKNLCIIGTDNINPAGTRYQIHFDI
jgi:hypothetical protein